MSADIEKLAVFDSRIVQSRPKFAVEKGALSLTNAPFNAIAATQSQHTYNIYVPSENVFVDRAMEWSSTVYQQMTVAAGPLLLNEPIVQAGVDFALRSFPLNALCSTLSATINDTTAVINTQDVLDPVLRLADYRKNKLQRTCPTMLDTFASYNDAFGANLNPLAGWETTTDQGQVPNGAWCDLIFTDATGNDLRSYANGTVITPPTGLPYIVFNGVPVCDGVNVNGSFQIYTRWRSTEKLVLSPFTFADAHEWDTGLFGINNIQLIMNLRDSSRTYRTTTRNGRTISNINYNTPSGVAPSGFAGSVVNVIFLTPSLDVPLPPKSVVPYAEYPRYITQASASATIGPGQTGQIQSQTITLPQIPDLLIIYAKPSQGVNGATSSTDADFYLPIASAVDGVRNPININFDNFSGLLSSTTAEQLYAMSVKNGLEMDYNQFVGMGHSQAATQPPGSLGAGPQRVPLTGGFLVLKPSQDITLQAGQAPSLVGNFTLQLNLFVKNNTNVAQTPSLYIITVNSGFFESIRGSSRIIKGVLSEQDIITAPVAPMGTRDVLQRYVGGAFNFANMLSKAKDIYHATKPAVSAVKGLLPESGTLGKIKSGLSAVGYGGEVGAGGRMSKRLA